MIKSNALMINNISDKKIKVQEWRVAFGDKLYYRMIELGVTIELLSENTGVSISSISNYINGKTIPSYYSMIKICDYLEVDMNYFV